MKKCKSKMKFGDDYGDNCCTFHCDLETGHIGRHQELGELNGKHYVVHWWW